MKIADLSYLLHEVKEKNPLVLHYTNEVTINDCANITLALGASPLMSYSFEEVEDIIAASSAVVINIGTMTSSRLDLFLQAGKAANKLGKPVVLDPVGVFATKKRAEFVNQLITEVKFDVIKGNADEIQYIAGIEATGQGVDASADSEIEMERIKELAESLGTTIAITGRRDFITDGKRVIFIENGTDKLKSITGTGCMIASLIGSYLGIANDSFSAASLGVLTMSVCGEIAALENPPIGTFKVRLFNELYGLNEDKLNHYGRMTIQ